MLLKFISWNVNGLRAVVNKGFRDVFNDLDADFFCLQETKLQEGQIDLSFPGYTSFWNYAEKKGYSGTCIFTKHEPLSVRYGIGDPAHDAEGRVIGPEIPLHVSRFFPRFRMQDRPATDVRRIYRLAEIAGEKLKHVYTGNC